MFETPETYQESAKLAGIAKITYAIVGILALLLPFFFIPSSVMPFQLGKGLFLAIAVSLALVCFIVSLIQEGKVSVPKNLFFLAVLLLPVTTFISAAANGGGAMQFLGYALEIGTVAFLFYVTVLLFLVSELFQDKERSFLAYVGFFISFAVVLFFQLIRVLFGPEALSFGIFTSNTANLIGSWNDLGIFFAASAILSVVTLEMLQLNRVAKFLVYVALVASLFFLALVNFSTLWLVLALFALLFFVYAVSFHSFSLGRTPGSVSSVEGGSHGETPARKVSYHALALLVISVVFLIAGQTLGTEISERFNIANVEIRPSWSSTLSVVGSTIKAEPIFGSGPNTFVEDWLLYKPTGINETLFWNTDFNFGIGFIPSLFATTGILGILAWVFFLGLFVWTGVRAMFYPLTDLFARYLITSNFLTALFFWVMLIVYVPSTVIVVLAFFFTGLFAASLYREGILRSKVVSLSDNPKLSFLSVILLVALLIANLALAYLVIQKAVSLTYFQKSIRAIQTEQNVDLAETYMVRAIEWGGFDIYYRGLSEINLVRLDAILSEPGATPDSIRERFQQVLGNSIENARVATEIRPENYQNWTSLGRVYAALVPAPFQIPGAYENALATYEQARMVSPANPAIPLLLARLEVSNGNLAKAREYAMEALALKQSYAEAHFLMAQIEVTEGNVAEAITSLETTILLSPNDPGLLFQLGLLKYNASNFAGAAEAFSFALGLVPEYANAQYFLALSLVQLDRPADAITIFESLAVNNPENTELTVILENLREGNDPFANVPPPANAPETRPELPIEES
jgi:tetratricopeptide (TPR) repeat protein